MSLARHLARRRHARCDDEATDDEEHREPASPSVPHGAQVGVEPGQVPALTCREVHHQRREASQRIDEDVSRSGFR